MAKSGSTWKITWKVRGVKKSLGILHSLNTMKKVYSVQTSCAITCECALNHVTFAIVTNHLETNSQVIPGSH